MITIIRAPRRVRYSVISTIAIEDRRLSFKARGLLCYLLSKPDNWTIRTGELVNASEADGRDAVRAGLLELRSAGYLVFVKKRDGAGRISSSYTLYEEPAKPAVDGKTEDGKTEDGFSGDGKAVALANTDKPNNNYINIVINNSFDIIEILKENGGEAAPYLIELATAARPALWHKMYSKYEDEDFFKKTLAALAAYYSKNVAKAKKLKNLTQTANNWLRKDYIDPSIAEYRRVYLRTVKAAAGVDYDFNNNPSGTDVIGLNSLISKIEASQRALIDTLGLSIHSKKIDVYAAFLEAAPAFWKSQRPAALSRGFASIVGTIKQTKTKPKPKAGGYADFDVNDIENIL